MRQLLPLTGILLLWSSLAPEAAGAAERAKLLLLEKAAVDPLALSPEAADLTARVQVVQSESSAARLLPLLRSRGIEVLGYLPEDAYLVRLPSDEALRGLAGVRWHGALRPEWKLAPASRRLDAQAAVELKLYAYPGRSLRSLEGVFSVLGTLTQLRDDFAGTGHARIRVAPGTLPQVLARLAALEEVAWIEPQRPIALTNDDSIWVIQGGELDKSTPIFAHGITGTGQIIALADSGLDTDACQFRTSADTSAQTLFNITQPPTATVTNPDNKVITYYLLDGATAYDDKSKLGHGTHVSGCAAGDNFAHLATVSDPGRDTEDGMAPGAKIVFQDIGRRDGVEAGIPGTLVDMYVQAYQSGARIHNNSFGMTSADTSYGGESRDVDEAAWRLQDLLIVFSSGNLGPGAGTLDGTGSTSKNSVVVGGSLAGASNLGHGVCAFSSQGPTGDGRIRPDLVVPGAIKSALETTWVPQSGTDIFGQPEADSTTVPPDNNCAVDPGYRVGTSFAAGLLSGGAALVREYFTDGFWPGGVRNATNSISPSAALLKAVLINAAASITGPLYDTSAGHKIADLDPAPTNIQGWGLLHLDQTLAFSGDPEHLEVLTDTWSDGSDHGATFRPPMEEGRTDTFVLLQVRSSLPLRITLAWMDPAGTNGSGRQLVNDLDLEVADPAGTLYRGNVAFAANRSGPAGSAPSDNLNPVEQVILDVANPGDYTVRVVGRQVPGNGETSPFPSNHQGYALIAVGDFDGVCKQPSCQSPDADDAGTDAGVDAGGDPGGADPGDNGGSDRGDSGPGDAAGEDHGASEGGPGIVGGCGCSTSWPPSVLAIAGLVLAALRWRRRA